MFFMDMRLCWPELIYFVLAVGEAKTAAILGLDGQ